MDRHELNRMFDALAPDPKRERELLGQLLQDDARRTKPMKNWKRVVFAVAAAALLVTAATAAVVLPRIDDKVLDYVGVDPEDTQAVEEAVDLLYPGAMALDITRESNGATLHVTQILRDRYTMMILADFTAPEGTVLDMGEPDPSGVSVFKGFANGFDFAVDFLDAAGEPMGRDGLVASCGWVVLEDDDPLDNRLSMMFTLSPQMDAGDIIWDAVSLRVPAANLLYWDQEQKAEVPVYSGDWSFETLLPQRDIGWAMQMDQAIGELDGAAVTAEELYLSPMTIELRLKREGGLDFAGPLDDEGEAVYSRWLSIGNNVQRLTLTTRDGETIPLKLGRGGGGIGFDEKVVLHSLTQITDPAKFQGGTLTIEWDFYNSEESGSCTISLDGLTPVEPAARAAE